MATAKKNSKAAGAAEKLYQKLAKQLGATREEVELRALRELAGRLAEDEAPAPRASKPQAQAKAEAPAPQKAPRTGLPQRLYLLLDGRGLDGRGLPVEVIDLPATIGSSKRCTVWVNSPNIETRHLQITQDGGDWVLEDLGSARGTFLGDTRVSRRTIQHGEEYKLAGYLRMRTELR